MKRDWPALVRAALGPLDLEPARAADIVAELAQHAADHHAELVAAGVDDGDAVRQALAPLEARPEVARELRRADRPRHVAPPPPPLTGSPFGHLARDVVYAIRLLRRAPGFAVAAIVTLALGIGANAAIFSVVRAVVLRPPPYRDPAGVLAFVNSKIDRDRAGSITSSSLPDYEDWRRLTSFESVALLSGWTFNVSGLELPERIFGARVSGSLFPLLGTPPLLGRTIEPDDDRPQTAEVLVLGYRVWQRLFGGDPTIVGRTIMTEGRPHLVIGVMPPRFRFPTDDTEVWAAIKDNMTGMPRSGRFMVAVGRLKPAVTRAAAQAELDAMSLQLEAAYPETNKGWRVRLVPAQDAVVGETRRALITLVAAVALVLLIACANVSNLLLARATARRRETAIRLALGASRARIVAQWLTENMVLSIAGGACGIALAYLAVRLVAAYGPTDVPRLDETAVDLPVLWFTLAVAMLAGAIPAVAPAIRALRLSSPSALKDGFGGYAGGARLSSGRLLVVGEVALAMTLAIAGALLLQSFARLTAIAPGFDPDRVLSLKVFLTPPRYLTVAQGKQYVAGALERIATVPGVESVASVSQLPLGDPSSTTPFEVEGQAVLPADRPQAAYRAVSAGYFHTMRIPIIRGRGFTAGDRENAPFVVIVNESAARRLWPSEDPVGRRVRWTTGMSTIDGRWHSVVGVVADVKSNGLDRPEAMAVYAPYPQRMFTWLRWTSFVVRTTGEPMSYARAIRQELTKLDPLQPVFQIAPLDAVVSQSVAARRFHTGLIDLFAALALALCFVGVYGTIGYWVAERSREIGVRMALGATARRVRLMVVGRAGALTAIGVAVGALLSAATMELLSSLLFDVRPFDPPTIAAVALLVGLVGCAAAYIPARRAARLDPLAVIRSE